MIEAVLRGDARRGTLMVTGHAGYDPGHDIVCAGVSALSQAFLAWCLAHEARVRVKHVSARSGNFRVDYEGDCADALGMTLAGLRGIEKSYPDYVKIDTEKFLRKC